MEEAEGMACGVTMTLTRLSYSLNMEHYLKALVVYVSSISGLVGACDDI